MIFGVGETYPIPCGCSVWRLGSASGVQRCWQHHIDHESGGPLFGQCGCVECRAGRRMLPPAQFVLELYDQHTAGRRPPNGSEMPDAYEVAHCGCLWTNYAKTTWRIAKPCRPHEDDRITKTLENDRARTSASSCTASLAGSATPPADPMQSIATCPCMACKSLRGDAP